MKIFTARCLQYIALALMILLCIVGFIIPNIWVMCAGGVIGIAGAVVWVVFGRCPHCGEFLGRHMTDRCPHCGEKIEK